MKKFYTFLALGLLGIAPAMADIQTNANDAANQPTGSSQTAMDIAKQKAAAGDPTMLKALQAQQALNKNASNQNSQTAQSARDGDNRPIKLNAPTYGGLPPVKRSILGGTRGPAPNAQIVDPNELRQAQGENMTFLPREEAGKEELTTIPSGEINGAVPPELQKASGEPGKIESDLGNAYVPAAAPPKLPAWVPPTKAPTVGAQLASMRLLASAGVTTTRPVGLPTRASSQQAARNIGLRMTWASQAMPSASLVAYLGYRHGLVVGSTPAVHQRIPPDPTISDTTSPYVSSARGAERKRGASGNSGRHRQSGSPDMYDMP